MIVGMGLTFSKNMFRAHAENCRLTKRVCPFIIPPPPPHTYTEFTDAYVFIFFSYKDRFAAFSDAAKQFFLFYRTKAA